MSEKKNVSRFPGGGSGAGVPAVCTGMAMKKKSMVRKIINLSPLVDVFMIIIFWYIMFSNQNLQNQEENAQGIIDGLRQELEGLRREADALENDIKNLEIEKKSLAESLLGESEDREFLEAEKEKLKELLNQEGQFLVLRLVEGLGNLRTLEVMHGESLERITFSSNDRPAMQEKLKAFVLEYLGEKPRLSVLFLYGGDASFSRDVSAVEEILEGIRKENYFVYTKINLDR